MAKSSEFLKSRSSRFFIVCLLSLAAAPCANAQVASSMDSSSEQALRETQQLLRDKNARQESIKNDKEATNVDNQVQNLMGSDSQAVYELSADIFSTIAKDAAGDPAKMQEALNKLMKNPESFSSKLTPEQLARIKELAGKIEARKPATGSPR